jgi:hypothetical protein
VPPQTHKVAPPDGPHQGAVDSGVTAKFPALAAARRRAGPATPVEAAAALIELALHESQAPVEELSGAVARLAQLPQDDIRLARDIAVCVENLQFHDRLTQQLTQVRNLLATLAANGDTGRSAAGDQHSWHVMLENLRARFTSDSHRILFNLLLPGGGGRSSMPSLHANEGSVELF